MLKEELSTGTWVSALSLPSQMVKMKHTHRSSVVLVTVIYSIYHLVCACYPVIVTVKWKSSKCINIWLCTCSWCLYVQSAFVRSLQLGRLACNIALECTWTNAVLATPYWSYHVSLIHASSGLVKLKISYLDQPWSVGKFICPLVHDAALYISIRFPDRVKLN